MVSNSLYGTIEGLAVLIVYTILCISFGWLIGVWQASVKDKEDGKDGDT